MKLALRNQAVRLRRDGWSYNIISRKLGVGKGTLNYWLKDVPYAPNADVRQRVREGPARNAMLQHADRIQRTRAIKAAAAREIGKISLRDLWMLGIGLYIGEGAKLYEMVRVINSDPDIIRLAIRWFRKVCGLTTKNFCVAVHLYPDVPKEEALAYWSKITGIPRSQFSKTQIDRRTDKSRQKRRTLPYGTVQLKIRSCGNPRRGVFLHRRITGWIEAAYRQLRA